MELEQEIKTYKTNKDNLLSDRKGRFVLIKGDKIIADFETYGDALEDGYQRFGNEAFLVKEVRDEVLVNYFSKDINV